MLTISLTPDLTVLDPWINLEGLLRDCEQDDDLAVVEEQIRHVLDGKAQLECHFKKYYLPSDTNTIPAHTSPSINTAGSSTTTASPGPTQRRQFKGKSRCRKSAPTSTPTGGPIDELAAYFKLDAPSEDCPFDDPLKWWQSKSKTFPHLAQLARDIFSIPGRFAELALSSFSLAKPRIGCAVAVERIFSSGRDTISLRRSSLKPETIRSLMLLKQKLLSARSRLQEALAASRP